MSTTITTQDIEDLRRAERDARQAVADAERRVKGALKHNEKCQRLLEDWRRSTGRDDEPRWADNLRRDGMTQDGRRPDIPQSSPIPAETIEEFEQALVEAQERYDIAVEELAEAVDVHKPQKPSKATGWIANKAKTINGVAYEIGDPVDIDDLSIDKLAILQEERIIRKAGA